MEMISHEFAARICGKNEGYDCLWNKVKGSIESALCDLGDCNVCMIVEDPVSRRAVYHPSIKEAMNDVYGFFSRFYLPIYRDVYESRISVCVKVCVYEDLRIHFLADKNGDFSDPSDWEKIELFEIENGEVS